MNYKSAIKIAIKNIARHGDTDVFPFPIETLIFHDMQDACIDYLASLHENFDSYLAQYPPSTLEALTQVGYTGFRWTTQIEPFWNAYYLALVVMLADQIEQHRVSLDEEAVFSYRYEWNEEGSKLFKDITWSDYKNKTLDLSNNYKYVVVTDIADFYPRIYHHRIENALKRLPNPGDIPKRIMKLIGNFSKNVSYGVPVGGPASRILSELALDSTDKLLLRKKIKFCRYADDYCIFCDDRADAYRVLVALSESLFNEGLVLQKKKTRILTTEEYRQSSKLLDAMEAGNPSVTEEQRLLNVSLRYDPYSETAEEDYETLKKAIGDVDIIGILGREVAKSTIDSTVVKQAIRAIKALSPFAQFGAVKTLLDEDNLVVLSPVFVTVMRAVRGIFDDLSDDGKEYINETLTSLYDKNSHLLSVDLNLSFYIQAVAKQKTARKEEILIEIYERKRNPLIKRQIILVMANWDCHYWLTGIKRQYEGLSSWEKRYFIGASYKLGDEGRHWRDYTKPAWSPIDAIVRDWFSERIQKNQEIPV